MASASDDSDLATGNDCPAAQATTPPHASAACSPLSAPTTSGLPTTFHPFLHLPPELRLRIYHLSLSPRVVELHTPKALMRDFHPDKQPGSTAPPPWQSRSRNPPLLSVCVEARLAARESYTVAVPLAGESEDRLLYLDPTRDTVAVLGDLDIQRLGKLFTLVTRQEEEQYRLRGWEGPLPPSSERGLKRLGLSVGCFAHDDAGTIMSVFGRTLLRSLEEMILFLYVDRVPPWSFHSGACVLGPYRPGSVSFQRFSFGKGRSLRTGDDWMVVGRNPLSINELIFLDGVW